MPVAFLACRIGLLAFLLPLVYIVQPSLLLIGDAGQIALTLACVTLGVLALAVALEGYLFKPLTVVHRTVLLVLALGLLFQTGPVRWALGLAVVVLMAIAVWRHRIAGRLAAT